MIFNSSGGGASIKYVTAETEDALLELSPSDGTIGIITSTAVKKVIVSNAEPSEKSAGYVWITLSSATDKTIDLKCDGTIMLPINVVRQYEDDAWVIKTYRIRENGEWSASELLLLDGGTDKTEGGWSTIGPITKNTDNWEFTTGGMLTTNDTYTVSFSSLRIDGYCTLQNPSFSEYSAIELLDTSNNIIASATLPTSRDITVLDISDFEGQEVKVRWAVYGSSSYGVYPSGYAYKIWFS